MKTLVVTCEAKINNGSSDYENITIFGQTDDSPEIQAIPAYDLKNSNYDGLMDHCRERYCNYYGCDNWNIIHMTKITLL